MSTQTQKSETGLIGKASGFALGKAAKDIGSLLKAMKNLAEGSAQKAFEFLKECGVANTLTAAFTQKMPFARYDAPQVATAAPAAAARSHAPSLGLGGSSQTRRKSEE